MNASPRHAEQMEFNTDLVSGGPFNQGHGSVLPAAFVYGNGSPVPGWTMMD